MSDETRTITVNLSPRAAALLKSVNDVYIKDGGPVWECAQEWDEQYTEAELEELSAALDAALEVDSSPAPRT